MIPGSGPERHVSVCGREGVLDTQASPHGLQTQKPLGLPYIPLESLGPRVTHHHIPFCRAAARRGASLLPETSRLNPAGLFLGPGLSPRSWAFWLSCPSRALRSDHHESLKATCGHPRSSAFPSLRPAIIWTEHGGISGEREGAEEAQCCSEAEPGLNQMWFFS